MVRASKKWFGKSITKKLTEEMNQEIKEIEQFIASFAKEDEKVIFISSARVKLKSLVEIFNENPIKVFRFYNTPDDIKINKPIPEDGFGAYFHEESNDDFNCYYTKTIESSFTSVIKSEDQLDSKLRQRLVQIICAKGLSFSLAKKSFIYIRRKIKNRKGEFLVFFDVIRLEKAH